MPASEDGGGEYGMDKAMNDPGVLFGEWIRESFSRPLLNVNSGCPDSSIRYILTGVAGVGGGMVGSPRKAADQGVNRPVSVGCWASSRP